MGGLGALSWTAFKVGALSYGGGFVIIPLMQADAVHTYHWMTNAEFLNAVALGQVTPGPVVATVAAVGYAAHGIAGGLLAAAVAFTPSFSFILLGGQRFARLRESVNARAFLDGAGPAAIGAILGAAITLTLALRETWQFAVLAAAAIALLVLRRHVVETLLVRGRRRRRARARRCASPMIKDRIYDAFTGGLDRKGFGQRRERQVAELRGDVLEVGAGTGLNLPRYRRADRLVALEPHRTYARRLRARAGSAHVPVEVVAGSAEELPFPDGSFDNVVTTLSLCSVRDLDVALAEIRRVLRPGGALHFLEHVRGEGDTARWQDRLTPIQRRIADGCHLNRDTAAAIERAGFELAELERFEMPAGAKVIRPAIQGTALSPG